MVDLSFIYEMHFSANLDLVKTINAFLKTGLFMYAEPKFVPRTQFNPNDPQNGGQYHLTKIDAYNAWDIHKGDSNTVIGITDTVPIWIILISSRTSNTIMRILLMELMMIAMGIQIISMDGISVKMITIHR
ncbi:MAG: hypothetical protein IPJ86_05585 [Bacteroidetes bacterium]|nr:hypothetical protein [Bacteroidota bacterium]